jgi:hypothetical protein
MSVSLKVARILTVCVAIMLLLNAWSLFDFWNWLHNGAGEKTVDILIRIALILFFSPSAGRCWRALSRTVWCRIFTAGPCPARGPARC